MTVGGLRRQPVRGGGSRPLRGLAVSACRPQQHGAYAPLWLLTLASTRWAATLDQDLLGLKLLAALCFGISALLVWHLAERRTRWLSPAFFAWNPAVLVEGPLRLHNDLLLVPFVLAALWLLRRRQPGRSMAVVVLAALAKLSAAPVGVAVAVSLAKAGRRRGLSRRRARGDRILRAVLERPRHVQLAVGAVGTRAVVGGLVAGPGELTAAGAGRRVQCSCWRALA